MTDTAAHGRSGWSHWAHDAAGLVLLDEGVDSGRASGTVLAGQTGF